MVQDMDDVMFGRPELLFRCKFRPRATFDNESSDDGDEVFELPPIFFSAFERTNLSPRNPRQRDRGIIQLYEPGP